MTDFIITLFGYLDPIWIFFMTIAALFIIAVIYLYGDAWALLIKHKRNKVRSLIAAILILITVTVLFLEKWIQMWVRLSIVFILILYLLFYVYSWKHFMPWINKYIGRYERYLSEGALFEHKDMLEKIPPGFFITKGERNLYYLHQRKYFMLLNNPQQVITVLNKVEASYLYDDEKKMLNLQYAISFAEMGAMNKAERYLEQADAEEPQYWNVSCYIADVKGNLEDEENAARKGLECAKEEEHLVKCCLNNNMSRVYAMRQNQENALVYMRWAKRELDQVTVKNMDLIMSVYGNLILMLVRKNPEDSEIEQLRSELEAKENLDNLNNYIAYDNIVVEMFRQAGINDYYSVVANGYMNNRSKIERIHGKKFSIETACNQVSTFRMLLNGNFPMDGIIEDINRDFRKYQTLEKEQYICLYQELHAGFGLMHPMWQTAFKDVYDDICNYYSTRAVSEVDYVIVGLKEFDVYGYLNWMRKKAYILKAVYKQDFYLQVEPIHRAITDRCHKAFLYKEETREYMLWLDDFISPEVWQQTDKKPALLFENMEILSKAEIAYNQVKDSPDMYEFAILLSAIYVILDDKEKSRAYLDSFNGLNIDVHSYAVWLRLKYYHLLAMHGMNDRIDQVDFSKRYFPCGK